MVGHAGGPYRTKWTDTPSPPPRDTLHADLRAVYMVIWVGSIARVVLGLRDHHLGTELTLAAFAVVVLPMAALMKS